MEVDECSVGGETGAEEDEDDASSQGSDSNCNSSSIDGSSTSTDSEEDTGDERNTTATDSQSSADEDDEETDHPRYSNVENSDEVKWETCATANTRVKLPQELCEHLTIFKELLDYPNFWQECLKENQKESLCNLLPKFPKDCDIEEEMEKSLQMLFHRENHRFGIAPLEKFHKHLSAGHYRPDIKRMRSLVRQAQRRRLLFEERKRSYELAHQVLKSRESLLTTAYKQGFGHPPHHHKTSKLHWRKPKPAMVEEKTQLRYMEELVALKNEFESSTRLTIDTTSENEENYPHHQLTNSKQKKRKRAGTMGVQGLTIRGMQLGHEDESIQPVFSTLQRAEFIPNRFIIREQTEDTYRALLVAHKKRRARRDVHPELNTQGIALADLTQRAQVGQKLKLPSHANSRTPATKKRIKLEQPKHFNQPLIKSEIENIDTNRLHVVPEVDAKMITSIKSEPIDPLEFHQMPKKRMSPTNLQSIKPIIVPVMPEIKKEIEDSEQEDETNELNVEAMSNEIEVDEENIKKELDLDGIDMMQIPIQLDDGIDILDQVKCEEEDALISIPEKSMTRESGIDLNGGAELMQETHASFFSLIRDAFTSKGEFRMSTIEMKEAVLLWQENPISPLNDWYSLAPSWPALVPLALGFLAGEFYYSQELEQLENEQEFVPYLENKGRGVYAWIGAGRDSDSRLADLCSKFLIHKDSLIPPRIGVSTPTSVKQSQIAGTTSLNGSNIDNSGSTSPCLENTNVDGANIASVTEWEPPRALCPTEWKVRPSTPDEREEFRRQERMRYAAPHKAFTYRMHGYESVVGPVKGIYQHNVASGLTKPRGHSLLVAERPNFVTILALVRDATARLPNGEGTRADICQLLKDSQYIREQGDNDDKEGYLHSVVSGALDRLHYETDPCVRYYPRRKEWLYLHRARSESEFEMYHQQLQGVAKNKKNVGNTSRNKSVQSCSKSTKEQSPNNVKESTPKKERKSTPVISRKEIRKTEDKIVIEQPVPTPTTTTTTTTMTTTINNPVVSAVPIISTTPSCTTTSSISNTLSNVEKECESKPQFVVTPKKPTTNIGVKPITVVKTNPPQSLLQSNQHFPHHQIQVSTSAGLQTIRLSGHSVLQSTQSSGSANNPNVGTSTSNLTTIFPTQKIQNQSQQQNVISSQTGKSILQTATIKQSQQQQTHVLPGKTLLASQIKLVSSGQIKSLLTGHGLQGQTIFIKQSTPSSGQPQQIQQQQQLKLQQQSQQQRPVVISGQQQQQQLQAPGMQRIIAQIGGKPIAVQIQQPQQQQQQQQQQKILAKVLTSSAGGQLISVESLLAQKGLKLASTSASQTTQLNRQGKQVLQTQYQVVSQSQSNPGQSKIIVSSQSLSQQQQTVRMVTAQLAGKPIVLASGGNKNLTGGSVVLGKPQTTNQSQQQTTQPIILPSQLLNIKTLHGLKVIPTPAGLKTPSGAAVYARVVAPTSIASATTQPSITPQPQSPQSSRNNYTSQ